MSLRLRRHWRRQAARESELVVPSPHLWLPGREWPERSPFARGLADSPYIGNPTCPCPGEGCTDIGSCFDGDCSESSGSDYVATIAGVANSACTECANYNAAHTIEPVDAPAQCAWSRILTPFCTDGGAFVWFASISVILFCSVRAGPNRCRINGTLTWIRGTAGSVFCLDPGTREEYHFFSLTLPIGQSFVDGGTYQLAYDSSACTEYVGGPCIDCSDPVTYECDPTAATFEVDFNAP